MKKFIIISFVFVMLLSISAMASETRVRTMGDNNNVLLDDANIWLYPSRILDYPNLATAELGYYSDEFDELGINWKLDDKSVLGTYFSTKYSDDRIDLFYGTDLGGSKFGAHLNFQNMSTKSENDTTFTGDNNRERSQSFYDFTFSLTEATGQWDVALNAGLGTFTNLDDSGLVISEPDGMYNFGLYGRYFQVKNPNYTLIHHIAVMSAKDGYKDAGGSYADKWVGFEIGSGFNFTPSSHVLGVFDFGFKYIKYTYEETGESDYDNKVYALPYFKMGLDGEVFKWLDVRFGATSYWTNDKDEFESQSYTQKYAQNDTYFGLGFNWNHLHVDTEANPDFFLAGPDFLSGASEDMSWNMSVTYDM